MQKEPLEHRMYFFVPYQLTGIQQAIQAGHAALEYARIFNDKHFIDFVDNWKTWIILNGGTTREDPEDMGSMQELIYQIDVFNESAVNKVNYTIFREPDLNRATTAICFICDERVFDYEKYPDLYEYILNNDFPTDSKAYHDAYCIKKSQTYEELKEIFPSVYKIWETTIGGKTNVFLRNLLKGKKLA